ncbi:SDR family oxidoreductase [Deinococcus alpinitundrae]|uniref:SDR family oxidoreductase n=1 Tax=Deinococcus alpinitundrae TaxID=468913 RepID=UPI00192A4FDF|nr:SDR family NAD(P)-dependent oxidoreductase [Deinococcus alpinitundrae]
MTASESAGLGRGKVLFITGASSGIGAAVARQAAAAGWRVALLARRLEKVQALAAELGGAALAIEADVTEWSDLERAVARTRDTFGQLYAVLANAGLSSGAPNYASSDPTPDAWREMILTSVLGAALTARASLPDLIASREHLLLVGSVGRAGRHTWPVQRHQMGSVGHGRQHPQGGLGPGGACHFDRAGPGRDAVLDPGCAGRPHPARGRCGPRRAVCPLAAAAHGRQRDSDPSHRPRRLSTTLL